MAIPGRAGQQIDLTRLSIGFTEHRLCTRCGTCGGVCPEAAIAIDQDSYPQLIADRCTDCGRCARTCPGGKVSYRQLNQLVFGHAELATSFDGHVRDAWVGYATDEGIRSGGAGGGVVTALLWDLISSGRVDGCLVTRMNVRQPWSGEPFIARSYADLLQSQGSRYMVIALNRLLAELTQAQGVFAVAALPCQVHGLRLALQEMPELAGKVAVIIGLFCGGALERYAVTELLAARKIAKEEIGLFEFRGGEWPGRIRVVMASGEIHNLHYSNYKDGAYNYLISLYMPERCQTCVDGSNEFADLAIGDAWTRDRQGEYKFKSHSKIFIRTLQGEKVIVDALANGSLQAHPVTGDASYRTQKMQTQRKGMNAPLRIERWRRQGRPVPDYDRPTPIASRQEALIELLVSACLYLGRYHWLRFPLMRFLTSSGAIPLIHLRLWLKKRKYQRAKR